MTVRNRAELFVAEIKKLLCKEVVIYLVIVPMLAVLVFGYLYRNRVGRDYPIVVVDEEKSAVTRLAAFYLDSAPELRVTRVLNSIQEGRDCLSRGQAEAVVYLRRNIYRKVLHKQTQTALVIVDGRNLVKANTLLTGIAKTLGTARIGAELKLMDKYFPVPDRLDKLRLVTVLSRPLGNPAVDYFLYILTGLMVMAIWQGTLVGSSLGVARERGRAGLSDTIAAFGSPWRYIFWRSLAVTSLSAPVTAATAAIFYGLYNAPCRDPFASAALLLLYTLTVVVASHIAGVFFRHASGVLQFFLFFTLPAFFISGYPFPRESIHPLIRSLAALLPTTPVLDALPRLNTIPDSLPYQSQSFLHIALLGLAYFWLGGWLIGMAARREKTAETPGRSST